MPGSSPHCPSLSRPVAVSFALVVFLFAALGLSPASAEVPAERLPLGLDQPVPDGLKRTLSAIERGDEAGFRRALKDVASSLGIQARQFLETKWLLGRVEREPAAVAALLREQPESPLMPRLKRRYLDHLAGEAAWGEYRMVFDRGPDIRPGTRRQCHYWAAELALEGGLSKAQTEEAMAVWERGRSQPEACDPAFAWLEGQGRLDESAYRSRIRHAIIAGKDGLARYLVRQGPAGLAGYRDRWVELRDEPGRAVTARIRAGGDAEEITQGLLWLAKRDPGRARDLLARANDAGLLQVEQSHAVDRLAALKAAYLYRPEAYQWLRELPLAARDEEVWTWTVRSALRHLDWVRVKQAIDAMPPELAEAREWRYWYAVADQRLGQATAARTAWRELATKPDYHGFLAADRLGIRYALPAENNGRVPVPDSEALDSLERSAGTPWLALAFALHRLGYPEDARRLFESATRDLPESSLPALAYLTQQVDWHDRLSVVIARMDQLYDPGWYAARFALPHRALVDGHARRQAVDSEWIYAVMRRESLFMRDIGSGAGAQGLMQLMPATARWINRRAGLGRAASALSDPDTNIALGAAYLGHMAERFADQYPLAIAAYNAGPGRIEQWLPQVPMPGDVWVDTILFDETRAYTQAVLAGMVTYRWRLSGEPRRLGELLTVVQPGG
ncbi:transglycosylase SLT domain-containing protein [Guyparkeria sp. 1SP6A2]|nr:transglycosylase SLT domain-containing protein [Guyparkeria sp. 1SP6A2]